MFVSVRMRVISKLIHTFRRRIKFRGIHEYFRASTVRKSGMLRADALHWRLPDLSTFLPRAQFVRDASNYFSAQGKNYQILSSVNCANFH